MPVLISDNISTRRHTLKTFVQCTEMRFASFFSGGFITAIVVNPPERKLAKRTSVYWCYLSIPLFPFEKTSKEKFKPSCFIPFIFNKGKKNNEFTVNCETKSVFEGLWLCLSSFFVKCQFIQGQRREKKGVDF